MLVVFGAKEDFKLSMLFRSGNVCDYGADSNE